MEFETKIISRQIGDMLYASGLSLGTAESCTGGLISEAIIATPGASNYFKGSVVSYTNGVKHGVLGVPEALLQQDAAGLRYELYLIELAAIARPEGLAAAAELRRRGRRAPLAFVARTPAHAYSAYRVDAMQYLLQPVHQPEVSALLKRAVEPEYGPTLTVTTADGVRALTYAEIEYLECTHHIVHFHLTTGEDVASLSLRVPFSTVAQPLLADGRFVQPHRSYVVNLEAVQLLSPGEVRMRSGARIPIPRGREAAVREAFCARLG